MSAAGLVADQHVADSGVVERVVGREVRPSGQPEYDVHTFCLKALHHGIDCSHRAYLLSTCSD
jgi:hypothetical protein